MRRPILTVIAGGSLLAFLATAGLWASTLRHGQWLQWDAAWALRPSNILRQTSFVVAADRAGIYLDRSVKSTVPLRSAAEADTILKSHPFFTKPAGFRWLATADPLEVTRDSDRRDRTIMGPDAHALTAAHHRSTPFGLAARTDHVGGLFVTVRFWLLLTLSSAPLALRVLAWRRDRRRIASGLCARCGYDLRATPGRCPECGTVVAG